MRLVCPNCAAQYEVDDSAIPENGRDVQCANCGNTWFQGPAAAADETGEQNGTEHLPAPTPRATDPSVLDILRREAEHETTVRNSEIEAAEREQARDEADADRDEDTDEPAIEPSVEPPEDAPTGQFDGEFDDTANEAETGSTEDEVADSAASTGEEPAAIAAASQSDDAQDDEQDGGDELPNETFANRARAGRAKLRANRADIERAHHQRQQISTPDTETTSGFEEIAPTPQPSVSESDDGEEVEGRRHSSLPEIKVLQESLRIARDKSNRAEPADGRHQSQTWWGPRRIFHSRAARSDLGRGICVKGADYRVTPAGRAVSEPIYHTG
ncbi:MAG: hypothetical protein GXP05_04695 [Alphaproteobacteria bacterium]|nr:hypothetical protein [Alphaproteobacteria bacterium]